MYLGRNQRGRYWVRTARSVENMTAPRDFRTHVLVHTGSFDSGDHNTFLAAIKIATTTAPDS